MTTSVVELATNTLLYEWVVVAGVLGFVISCVIGGLGESKGSSKLEKIGITGLYLSCILFFTGVTALFW